MRRLLVFVATLAVLGPAQAGHRASPPPLDPATPRLAVVIVADGLSFERLTFWRPWFTSGLKRLLDEGAVATECRYRHLNTATGPGHASIATGAPPRVHGITLNQWYVPSQDRTDMASIYSSSQPTAGEPGNAAKTIPGPGRLRAATLGDRLVARDPRAKVVAISNKDRAAILSAGRDPRHAVYWYSPDTGTYVTSAAYDADSPAPAAAAKVVNRFNADRAGAKLAERFGTTWSRLPLPDPVPAPGFESGLAAYQDAIVGAQFPHDLTKAKPPLPMALLWTSFADRLLADLALDLLGDEALGLGRDDVPDLLAVSFSANDFVSHYYGPESVEELEILRALDVEIGRLLDGLTARFGKGGVVVALTADHGFMPLPEAIARRDPGAGALRVHDDKILRQLNQAVDAQLKRAGAAPLVFRIEGCSLWLDRTELSAKGAPSVGRVLGIVRRELATTWKDAVLRTFVLGRPLPAGAADEVARHARNDRFPGRSGDLFLVPRVNVLLDPYGGTGSNHGTPWDYDTHVPMIFWGDGIAPRTITSPSTPYDLAPTLGSWLGVSLPESTGTRLTVR